MPASPSAEVVGRVLTCVRCGEEVEVFELPGPFLAAERYVCGRCLESGTERPEPSLLGVTESWHPDSPERRRRAGEKPEPRIFDPYDIPY